MSKLYGITLQHSQGPWKDHKYIKKENGVYIYQGDQNKVKASNSDLSKIDTSGVNIDKNKMVDIANDKLDAAGTRQIAKLLIGGLYGDAAKAKSMLGKNYESIRKMADQMVENNDIDEADLKKAMEQANVLTAALGKMKGAKTQKKSSLKNTEEKVEKTEELEKEDKKKSKKKYYKINLKASVSKKAPDSIKQYIK